MTIIPESPAPSYRVTPLNRFVQGGRWRVEAMRSYRQPMLLWFTRGQGRITVSGVTRGFGAHNLVFLPAGVMHGFETSGQVFGSAVFLPNDPTLMLPNAPIHLRFRDAVQQGELTVMIDNLSRELERDLPARDRALGHHAGLISVWIERQMDLMPEMEMLPDASRRLAAAYSAMVEEEFMSGKAVSDYAKALGVTSTHLSRACNIACARPASAILSDRIHFEARRMLADTQKPVKEIASELGFASAAYFTRAFHKQTGVTPSDFRTKG
ncbi:MAG: helix-turn-helix domain-containing protein [Paracoccaceae bacterium]